jgi:hypothetical protein
VTSNNITSRLSGIPSSSLPTTTSSARRH